MTHTVKRAAALVLSSLALAACDGRGESARDMVQSTPAAAPPSAPADMSGKGFVGGVSASASRSRGREEAQARQVSASPAQAPRVSTGMIIRNGSVSVQVDSIEVAVAAVRALAAQLGGYVGNVSIMSGEHEVRSATLEVKVPATRFDEALAGVRPIGKVEHSTTSAVDVGEEYVDVSARVANAKRLEARLVALLAQRTGKLEDVLAVERELARVREEIERYEGRLRYLDANIATSTIAVSVHEKAPLVASHPGVNPIRQAFVNMWRNFVAFVALGIEAMGVIVPVAVLALLAWLGWKRVRRARLESRAVPTT